MFNYYFNIGLIYFIIGIAVAFTFYFLMKKRVLGKFWGALAIAIVGSYLGGVIEYIFGDVIDKLANVNNAVNIFPPIITAFIFVWIFSKVSEKE